MAPSVGWRPHYSERVNDASQPEPSAANASLPAIQRYNRLATWSLIASFLGLALILPIVGSIIGIVFGRRAARTIEQTGERGGGAAQAAVIFGWFGIVEVSIVLIFVVIIVLSAANS